MIKLYHKDIYVPQYLINECLEQQKHIDSYSVKFTKHVYKNLGKDKSHMSSVKQLRYALYQISLNPLYPIEVESDVVNGKLTLTKYVVRVDVNRKTDLILVIRNNVLVTFYRNEHNDTHPTLDINKYEKKPKIIVKSLV